MKESKESLIIPTGSVLKTKQIDGFDGYCLLESITVSVYTYPAHVTNKTLSADAKRIWIYNFPIEIKDGKFSAVGDKNIQSSNTEGKPERIDLIKDLVDRDILAQMKGKILTQTTDSDGTLMYGYEVQKTYNKIIKKPDNNSSKNLYVKTYTAESTDEAAELPADFIQIAVSSGIEKVLKNGVSYVRIQADGKPYFVSESAVKQNSENLLAEFMENCQTVNFGKNPIAGKDICPEDKLYIEQNNRNHNMDAFKKKLRERLLLIKDEKGNNLEGCIPDPDDEKETSIGIYKEGMAYQHLMHTYLKKTVSKHPLEWDEQLLKPACASRGIRPFSGADDNDIFKDISKEKKELKTNSFYFASPIYFYSRMDELGLLFRNPYEGYKRTFFKEDGTKPKETGDHLESGTIDVGYGSETNPGFAPLAAVNPNTPSVEYGGVRYAGCSSPFNIRRAGSSGSELKHTGIDLAPGGKTKIVSLTYGTVWAYTFDKDYGNVLVVKDDNKDILYFLAHLESSGCKVMQKVNPGDEVAMTGNTGAWAGTAVHLHLEVYECKGGSDEPARDKFLNKDKNKAPGTGADAELVWINRSGFESGEKRNKVRRNPFKHTEKYKG